MHRALISSRNHTDCMRRESQCCTWLGWTPVQLGQEQVWTAWPRPSQQLPGANPCSGPCWHPTCPGITPALLASLTIALVVFTALFAAVLLLGCHAPAMALPACKMAGLPTHPCHPPPLKQAIFAGSTITRATGHVAKLKSAVILLCSSSCGRAADRFRGLEQSCVPTCSVSVCGSACHCAWQYPA